jgi:adenosylcobinamide-GDP ribazoletransferase
MKTKFQGRIATPEELIGETARAISFLSRLPIPSRFFSEDDGPLSATARTFPLAGLLIALPSALLIAGLVAIGAPPLVGGALIVALQVAITGALHEDGLADTADGLGAGHERERALEIMKDSRIGVFGAVALMLSLLTRAGAFAALVAQAHPLAAALAVLGLAAASRAAMVWHWQALGPARKDGVAAGAGTPDETSTNWAIGIGVAVVVLCLLSAFGVLAGALSLATIAIATAVFTRHADARIGGHTGDTIGAAQQIAEVAGLVALVLCL